MSVHSRELTEREMQEADERRRREAQRQREEHERQQAAQAGKKQIGMLPGLSVERLFVITLRISALTLIAGSIMGTFYGSRGTTIPLSLAVIAQDITSQPGAFLIAAVVQGLLSLVQWGARQMAHRDRRWWALYLVSLSLSAWWNWTAYAAPLIAFRVPWPVALGIIIGGDIFPEVTLVKK